MLKKILNCLKYLALLAAIAGLVINFIWANTSADKKTCQEVIFDIQNADTVSFVNEAALRGMLYDAGLSPEGVDIASISTDSIEKLFNRSEYIESAQCVLQKNGDVRVIVSQLIPVLRVFDGKGSFYINKDGKAMVARSDIHTEVPLVNGNFKNPADALVVLPIAKYVENDNALQKLVTMYTVKDNDNIMIIPSVYGHVINFGDSTNIANKFAKLRRFYKEVMPVKGWTTYDTIYLKWNYQVVANRRKKRIKPVLVVDTTFENEAPSIESLTIDKEEAAVAVASTTKTEAKPEAQKNKKTAQKVQKAFKKKTN